MQAVSSSSGLLVLWTTTDGPDFGGVFFPGPGSPVTGTTSGTPLIFTAPAAFPTFSPVDAMDTSPQTVSTAGDYTGAVGFYITEAKALKGVRFGFYFGGGGSRSMKIRLIKNGTNIATATATCNTGINTIDFGSVQNLAIAAATPHYQISVYDMTGAAYAYNAAWTPAISGVPPRLVPWGDGVIYDQSYYAAGDVSSGFTADTAPYNIEPVFS
jgi:hypothetical protein